MSGPEKRWLLAERRPAFLRLTAQLWLHCAEHGKFPAQLSDCQTPPDPLLPLAEVHYDTHTLSYNPPEESPGRIVAPAGMEQWNTIYLPVWSTRFSPS